MKPGLGEEKMGVTDEIWTFPAIRLLLPQKKVP
jgi:hypothetical protein